MDFAKPLCCTIFFLRLCFLSRWWPFSPIALNTICIWRVLIYYLAFIVPIFTFSHIQPIISSVNPAPKIFSEYLSLHHHPFLPGLLLPNRISLYFIFGSLKFILCTITREMFYNVIHMISFICLKFASCFLLYLELILHSCPWDCLLYLPILFLSHCILISTSSSTSVSPTCHIHSRGRAILCALNTHPLDHCMVVPSSH